MKKFIFNLMLVLFIASCALQPSVTASTPVAPTPTALIVSTLTPDSTDSGLSVGVASGYMATSMSATELDEYAKLSKDLGFTYMRIDIDRRAIESHGGSFAAVERAIIALEKHGIIPVVVIGYAPASETLSQCVWYNCATTDINAFGEFVKKAATAFPQVHYWEIWNEPNLSYYGMYTDDGVRNYVSLLKVSEAAIHSVNETAFIISGGLSPAGDSMDNGSVSPATFVDTLYELGGNKYIDAIGVHPYMYPNLPYSTADWNNWYQMMVYTRQVMVDHGDSEKQIWITEIGAPVNGPGKEVEAGGQFNYGSDYVSEQNQLDLMIYVVEFAKSNPDWVGPVFWYSLVDLQDRSNSSEGYFGLIDKSGIHRPALDYLQQQLGTQ